LSAVLWEIAKGNSHEGRKRILLFVVDLADVEDPLPLSTSPGNTSVARSTLATVPRLTP
jgi:hypothetical protein